MHNLLLRNRIWPEWKSSSYVLIVLIVVLSSCRKNGDPNVIYETSALKISRLTENVFVHESYLETESFGKVVCNGLVVRDGNEAVIIDTPTDDPTSKELLLAVKRKLGSRTAAVVVSHFHEDCLGGLNQFHKYGIPSFSNALTRELAAANKKPLPLNEFDSLLELKVGTKVLVNEFLGEGHTRDNIVSYFPSDSVLFGGCLIKSLGAGKGNLEDANVDEWPETVRKVLLKYNEAMHVVPGHGESGDTSLLKYTINLFEEGKTKQ